MRRALGTAAAAIVLVASIGAGASADDAGGGTQRWTAGFDAGAPAFSNDIAVTPDGTTAFVTGGTTMGPTGHMATLAYGTADGAEKWSSQFPGATHPDDFGRGTSVAVSPDGQTLFVGGWTVCEQNCDASSFEGWVIAAFDVATGDRLWLSRVASMGGGPESIVPSPDGSQVYVFGITDGGQAQAVIAFDPATGDRVWEYDRANATGWYGFGFEVSPDGSTVYVADTSDTSSAYCSASGLRTTAIATADGTPTWTRTYATATTDFNCGSATALGVSPDGSRVFVTGDGGDGSRSGQSHATTLAYDASSGAQLWVHTDEASIYSRDGDVAVLLGVDPDGSKVFVSGENCHPRSVCSVGTVAYDTNTGNEIWTSEFDAGGATYMSDLGVSSDGAGLYLAGTNRQPCYAPCGIAEEDAELVAYDPDTGAERWVSTYPNNGASALAVSPDGSSVYLAGTFNATVTASRAATCDGACGYSTTRFNTRAGPGTFQDGQTAVHYDGWRGVFDKDALGGAYRTSRTAGESATFTTPKVSAFTWRSREGPRQGRARIIVDGRSRGTVDLYSPTPGSRSVSFTGLASKAHTVEVRVLGTKAAASTGMWVALDAFTYHAGRGIAEESSPQVRFDSWGGSSRRTASGGTYRHSAAGGAALHLDFTGRRITWVTATGPAFGRARVVIDGVAHTVDLYRPQLHWRVAISFAGLTSTEHHLVIRPLGRKDAASRSTKVVVDALVAHRR